MDRVESSDPGGYGFGWARRQHERKAAERGGGRLKDGGRAATCAPVCDRAAAPSMHGTCRWMPCKAGITTWSTPTGRQRPSMQAPGWRRLATRRPTCCVSSTVSVGRRHEGGLAWGNKELGMMASVLYDGCPRDGRLELSWEAMGPGTSSACWPNRQQPGRTASSTYAPQ